MLKLGLSNVRVREMYTTLVPGTPTSSSKIINTWEMIIDLSIMFHPTQPGLCQNAPVGLLQSAQTDGGGGQVVGRLGLQRLAPRSCRAASRARGERPHLPCDEPWPWADSGRWRLVTGRKQHRGRKTMKSIQMPNREVGFSTKAMLVSSC